MGNVRKKMATRAQMPANSLPSRVFGVLALRTHCRQRENGAPDKGRIFFSHEQQAQPTLTDSPDAVQHVPLPASVAVLIVDEAGEGEDGQGDEKEEHAQLLVGLVHV